MKLLSFCFVFVNNDFTYNSRVNIARLGIFVLLIVYL